VSVKGISDEFVHRVAADLRQRYSLDDEDVRALGARLANPATAHTTENLKFAERFVDEHHETFDRLAQ
jgi:hypothetical protein